jgi:cytochrome c-type biogenesis protein CcmH
MSTRKIILAIAVAGLIGLAAAYGVYAQQPTPSDDQVNAIARQLYCPVCENIPLDVCPTTACALWREQIRQELADGWTEQQIKDYFVQQYGDRVLGTPPARGINLLVYLVPPIALVAGIFVLYRAYHSWKRPIQGTDASLPGERAPGTPDAVQDEYIRRMEEELRRQK